MSIIGKSLVVDYAGKERKNQKSFNGKILRVNLSDGELWVEEPPEQFYRKLIGGRGFVLHYLLTEMPAKTDPISPENILIFATGVLSGTSLPGTGRHAVGAKSPLTGALASGEAGGWWGTEFKKAGFDAVVIQGKAATPVYLWINDGKVEIRDASQLWGQPTADVEEEIRAELGDDKIRIAQIGPGGEKLVKFACVVHDASRAAGRSGLGAVMGSKNLKAIAVRGSSMLGVADRETLSKTAKWISSNYKEAMGWAVAAGTAGSVKFSHDSGALPIGNFKESSLANVEKLDAEYFFPKMLKERDNCNVCPVYCKNILENQSEDKNRKIDPRYGGPEYETIGAFGTVCMVDDPFVVAKASELCEVYGLDTITTGNTIAFVMECAERGLMEPDPEDGFIPHFGDGDAMLESIHRIGERQGIGDKMAEGSAWLAKQIGEKADELLVTVKGQEIPMHDARLKNAIGLGYAVSPTGADHMHNMDDVFGNLPGTDVYNRVKELGFDVPLPLFGLPENKVQAFITETAVKYFMDCALICHFYPYEYQHLVDAVNGAVGWGITRDEIVEIGKRVINMGRLFILREGFTTEDDKLPVRMHQPHKEGPIAGKALTPDELHEAVLVYYKNMNWTTDGIPVKETLLDLAIEDYSK